MAEYIDKKMAIYSIESSWCMHCEKSNGVICDECEHNIDIVILDGIPAADVQPFKWVRCEEALPVYDGLVLVADRDNNIRLGIFTETGWLSQFGNPMVSRPKAWAKIPELPEPIKG